MVTLVCALVGGAQGSAFVVDIDLSHSVGDLKNAIKTEKRNGLKTVDADELQLFLAKNGDAWLESSGEDMKKLKNGIQTAAIEALTHEDEELQGESGLQKALVGMPEPSEAQIHVLVVVPTQRLFRQMLASHGPHLSRDALVEKLYDEVICTNFVLMLSPTGSGKTSLLAMFAARHPEFRCVPISFNDPQENASNLLMQYDVDVYQKTCAVPGGQLTLFMLDDCQRQYGDIAFWTGLFKGSASWIPMHVRFILSTTHLLETDVLESPIAFKSILFKLTREDFMISDDEALELLDLENGMPLRMKNATTLKTVMVHECNGHIGALRLSVDIIASHFAKSTPSEHELLQYYLSGNCLEQMARCLGSRHSPPSSHCLRAFLIECLIEGASISPRLNDEETRCFTELVKAGIITEGKDGYVTFTSPLAERYYFKWLFPSRGRYNPSCLDFLIRKVIGNMSASALSQSAGGQNGLSEEATLQQQFLEGLALFTQTTCSICPDLARVFPDASSDPIDGEMDFYLNGSLGWGIQLLVNGDEIGERVARFAQDGKYAALAAREYAVVDFRSNESGGMSIVDRTPERITVFFNRGDFSSCRCLFGLGEDSEPIFLKD